MKKALLLACLLSTAVGGVALAQAPVDAPGTQYFMGPSIGERWYRANGISGGIRSVAGTTDTILCSDQGKTIIYSAATAVAVTLPIANANQGCFGPNFQFGVYALGAGTVTVTPTTSQINSAANKAYATGTGNTIESDGTNYWAHF
jgi:hypothetical protein